MPKEVFGRDYKFLEREKLLSFEEIAHLARASIQSPPRETHCSEETTKRVRRTDQGACRLHSQGDARWHRRQHTVRCVLRRTEGRRRSPTKRSRRSPTKSRRRNTHQVDVGEYPHALHFSLPRSRATHGGGGFCLCPSHVRRKERARSRARASRALFARRGCNMAPAFHHATECIERCRGPLHA